MNPKTHCRASYFNKIYLIGNKIIILLMNGAGIFYLIVGFFLAGPFTNFFSNIDQPIKFQNC